MAVELSAPMLAGALQAPARRADLWLGAMREAMDVADITTPRRLAHWLGQLGHESGRLRYVRELWGPTRAQVRYEPSTTLSQRLGNVRAGDGKRYMGRGLIQVTGRANYARTTRDMRQLLGKDAVPDFLLAPALLEVPRWAALSAAMYWRTRGLNRWADADDIVTLTRRINGGTNGLADRQAIYTQALGVMLGVPRDD
jgi:putative chitinase